MDRLDVPKKAQEGDRQCQFVRPYYGQCEYVAVDGGNVCLLHGGVKVQQKLARRNEMYRLAQEYRERVDGFTDHEKHFSLQEEIGILRLMLEKLMASCGTDKDLFIRNIGQMSELTVKIQKLIDSSMRAEKYIGSLMSRSQAQKMLQDVINVIAEEISDPDTLERIARKFEFLVNKEYLDDEEA